jgi:glucokinase
MRALAVDLGGSHAACALVEDRAILASKSLAVDRFRGLGPLLPRLAKALHELLGDEGPGSCAGIAFSFCGLVDPVRGRVVSTNAKFDDAPAIDLAAWAQGEFGLPLRLENDARMALLGEWYAGAAQGFTDAVMVTLGTGVGGAAMMDGRLLHGKHFQAGCLGGHLGVNYSGRKCTCGGAGCMEAEASGWSLPLICREHPLFRTSALARLSEVTYADLFRLAAAGDPCACQVRDRSIEVWAAGIVSLVHAYDPEVVVMGGGVMNAAGQILPPLQRAVWERAWTPWGKVEIRQATLGVQASLLAAVPLLEAGAAC